MNWSEKDLENLKTKGFSIDDNKPWRTEGVLTNQVMDIPNSKKLKIEKISIEKTVIELILLNFKQSRLISEYVTEHRFDDVRRYRFDWAILDLKIGIEFEGLMSEKSRHTTVKGYSGDCTKYNLAIANGWRVLRYTVLNYQNLQEDLNKLLK